MAFQTRLIDLSRVPDSLRSQRFEIVAKAAGKISGDQYWEMLQTLLEDRFKIAFHRETKDAQVYALGAKRGKKGTSTGPNLSRSINAECPVNPNGANFCGVAASTRNDGWAANLHGPHRSRAVPVRRPSCPRRDRLVGRLRFPTNMDAGSRGISRRSGQAEGRRHPSRSVWPFVFLRNPGAAWVETAVEEGPRRNPGHRSRGATLAKLRANTGTFDPVRTVISMMTPRVFVTPTGRARAWERLPTRSLFRNSKWPRSSLIRNRTAAHGIHFLTAREESPLKGFLSLSSLERHIPSQWAGSLDPVRSRKKHCGLRLPRVTISLQKRINPYPSLNFGSCFSLF